MLRSPMGHPQNFPIPGLALSSRLPRRRRGSCDAIFQEVGSPGQGLRSPTEVRTPILPSHCCRFPWGGVGKWVVKLCAF